MKFSSLLVLGAGAAALAGCYVPHPRHHAAMRIISSLTCPESEGAVVRKSVAPDGKSCQYADSDGNQVTLQLIALQGGDVHAALTPLEASLRQEIPTSAAAPDAKGGDDRVDIDVPGVHIHASGKDSTNDNAHVRIGSDAVAGDDGAHKSGVSIDAHDKGAEIHVDQPGGDVRQTFILASDNPGPKGYKRAGYEARGPKAGPIVVASVLSKSDDHDTLRDEARSLVRLNVGG